LKKIITFMLFMSISCSSMGASYDYLETSQVKGTFEQINFKKAVGLGLVAGLISYAIAPKPVANKNINLGVFFTIGFGSSVGFDYYNREQTVADQMIQMQKDDIKGAF